MQFILNVALGEKKNVVAAFAGDLEEAHAAGVAFIREQSQCPVVKGDIVVTSNGGYPLDQNLYQSPKAVATAEACCAESGVIIMCCSCIDGMGGTNFEKLITLGTPEEIEAYLSQIPPDKTIPEQWAISTTKAVASFCLTSTVSPKRSSRWAKAPMWQRSWW